MVGTFFIEDVLVGRSEVVGMRYGLIGIRQLIGEF